MSSYIRKIEAERTVLRIVNAQCGDGELHGLSADAITTWIHKVDRPTELVEEVGQLGRMIGAMCERSGERDSSMDRMRGVRVARAVRRFVIRHGSKAS